MSVIHAFFEFVANWFGFVGSCIASPSGACIPFLAFLALGAAASSALVLVLLAYHVVPFRRHQGAARTENERAEESRREPSGTRIPETPVTA
jgi:heme/copper-type cytochrome/quinol oxidase subunit 2